MVLGHSRAFYCRQELATENLRPHRTGPESGRNSTASSLPDACPTRRRVSAAPSGVERIGIVQFAAVDETHEQIAHLGTVGGLIK